MRLLHPSPEPTDDGPVDLAEAYAADARPAPPGRPWVLANMVASVDGAASVEGVSGSLGGAADQAAFGAIRALADVILVAAGTVRAEGYRAPRTSEAQRRRRTARGQDLFPRLCVVTGRLDLDPDSPWLHPGDDRPVPLVATTTDADPARRAALEPWAEVVTAGTGHVDLGVLLAQLGERGVSVVLCEGGPSLLGQLVADDLLDELCLSLAPALVGGTSPRIAHAPVDGVPRDLVLDRVVEDGGLLLLRYRRAR